MTAETLTTTGLAAKSITVEFSKRGRQFTAASKVDVTVSSGEIVGLVGESGSGKSTISRVICGLQKEYSGTVELDGVEFGPRRTSAQWRAIQMVFQDPYASLDPRYTVRAMLTEVIHHHQLVPRRDIPARCAELMEMVRLPEDFLNRTPGAMSGGQRQRVAIARALAVEPSVIIADEAVSALDVSVQSEIIRLFARLRKELGLSILFISHDLAVVKNLCDRVYVIHNGLIVESNTTAELFAEPEDSYTRTLIEAVPRFSSAFLDRQAT